jgi:hypothetical protein
MAANDLYVWQKQIDDLLPGTDPAGKVEYTAATSTAPDTYVITVGWQEAKGDGNVTGDQSYVLTMQVAP